jgi:hypothetical protein
MKIGRQQIKLAIWQFQSLLRIQAPGGPGPHIYIPQVQGGPVIPPDTGFPFCHLLQSQSQSYFTTGSLPPICSSWQQAPWDPKPEFLLSNWTLAVIGLTSSPTRGWVYRLQLLLGLISAVILRSESRRNHDHILLSPTESESYITTDGQSDSLSWNKAPVWGLRPDFY